MTDTTSRALKQAWRLTADHPGSNEIHVAKLYELLINLELTSNKKILDLDSISVVKNFINDNKHRNLMITLESFKPFFDDLIGTPLQSIIGTPPPKLNLNLNNNPTASFINKELINLKKQNFNDKEDITYRDRLIDDLESSNSRLSENYNKTRRERLKFANDLNVSNQYVDQLHSSYDASKDNDNLIRKLNEQIQIQSHLVKELKVLQKDIIQPKNFTIKSIKEKPPKLSLSNVPSSSVVRKRQKVNWLTIAIYGFTFLLFLSLLNFSLEHYQDSIMDNLFEDIEL